MKCVRCSGLRGGYMDKMFDVENMVEMSYRIFRNEIYRDYLNLWKRFLNYMELSFFNLNSMERSNQVGKNTTTWVNYIPYTRDITKFTEGLYLIEDFHNFGHDYSKALIAWKKKSTGIGGKLRKSMGIDSIGFYLQSSAGAFMARQLQVWQIVLSKSCGVPGGYRSVR
ncbi:Cyclopropane-fatty-acyl-phospholipid synthase [Folsomia candida]|uniref:Cyclopropane-fatty-acyl-phospholipid synthase n=1 Tax=Folsomia candida TaxID=158441 RepID=A0A226E3N8_FOLCA|nr:Cyclopropane-fatty-acyl-phospholipid synthase [Folsomia candida]